MSLYDPPIIATGGDTVQDINGNRIHTFTTVGTSSFVVTRGGPVEVLVVAGGGGGGGNSAQSHAGGGGGAGELIYKSSFEVSGTVSVTVGAEGTTGGYPNHVGYGEGYVYGQSAISSSKSSVTWSSSGFSSVALYENASAVTVSYSRGSPYTDQGTYLYVGTGGSSAYYNGNIYEIEIFSTPLSVSDITIMG